MDLETIAIILLIIFALVFAVFFVPRYEYNNKPCQELGFKYGVVLYNHTYCLPDFIRID
jgi:hypothetical protein